MDSLWDGPAVPASAPLSRDLEDDGHHAVRSEPLFLEDNDIPAPRHREHSEHDNDDMDDLFAGFDNIAPLTEPLNVDALMQKARARLDAEKRASNASGAINEQSEELEKNRGGPKSKDGKGKDDLDQKSRRVIAKVDDERLLSDRGFPALIKEAQQFKPKGKGHEAADLDRLMDLYQLWAHRMFPKTQFRDTVEKVERVCRQKRMLVNLSRWRAEAQHTDEDQGPPIDPYSDDEVDISQQASARRDAPISVSDGQPTGEQPSTAPRVRVVDDVDDADIWAEIENPQPTPAPAQKQSQADYDQGDLEDWFALDDTTVPSSTKKTPSVPDKDVLDFREQGTNTITDDEIDALFAHIDDTDNAMCGAVPHAPLPTEGDFEDMYN